MGTLSTLINKPNNLGETPASVAVQRGSISCLKLLIEHTNAMVDTFRPTGENLLHFAIKIGNPEIIACLIEKKACIGLLGMKDRQGLTPTDYINLHGKNIEVKI